MGSTTGHLTADLPSSIIQELPELRKRHWQWPLSRSSSKPINIPACVIVEDRYVDLRAKEIHGGVSRQGKYKKSFDLQHYACMNIYTEQGFLRIIQEIWMEIDSRGITYRNMSERLLIMPIQYKLLQCNYVFYWTYHGNWGKNIYLVFYSIQQSGALANLHVIRKHLF